MKALDVLGWVVVHATWQAATIVCAAGLILRLMRASPPVHYAIAFGALAMVATTPIATGLLLVNAQVPVIGAAGEAAGTSAGRLGVATGTSMFLTHTIVVTATRWIGLAWLGCIVVLLVRWCGGWWLIVQIRRRGTRPARVAWHAALGRVASRMGVVSTVELLESSSVDTPTVVGHRPPVVLLPVPAFEALPIAEAESVLAHELAHVRRRDFVANGAQSLIEILFFFHPLVRWLSHRARDERELCCDEAAVEASASRLVYVRALAHLETVRVSLQGSRLALAANGGTLLRRIQYLTTAGDQPRSASSGACVPLALTATLALLATVGSIVVPPTLHAIALANPVGARYTVRAADPAGAFTITFERGRPVRATVDDVAIARERLVTRGDSLFVPWPGRAGSFVVRMKANGFTWTPRQRQ